MFYDHFLALCRQKGISPSRAAEAAGVSKSAVTNWKQRAAEPTGENAKKLCGYFGVSRSELFGDAANKPAAENGALKMDDFTYALCGETEQLTEENKQKLLEMARFFKQQQEKTDSGAR